MKPRLESADWTHEDCDVARHTAFRMMERWDTLPQIIQYAWIMTAADRRDADRMLAYGKARLLVGRQSGCILGGWDTALWPYDDVETSLHERGLTGYIPRLV